MNTNDPTLYEKLHKQAIKNYIEQHDSFMQAQLDSVMISQETSQDRGLRQLIRPMSALLKANNNGEEEKDRVQTLPAFAGSHRQNSSQQDAANIEIDIRAERKGSTQTQGMLEFEDERTPAGEEDGNLLAEINAIQHEENEERKKKMFEDLVQSNPRFSRTTQYVDL